MFHVLEYTHLSNLDPILYPLRDNINTLFVVDGADCVGKTKLIRDLLTRYPRFQYYRPDYNMWSTLNYPREYRWSIFMSLLDFWNKDLCLYTPMLVDRGVLSGVVYNCYYGDIRGSQSLLSTYVQKVQSLSDLKIIHLILSPKTLQDHRILLESRGESLQSLEKYDTINQMFRSLVVDNVTNNLTGYLLDFNVQKQGTGDSCLSCCHYSARGECLNQNSQFYHRHILSDTPRCSHSTDEEVQDL